MSQVSQVEIRFVHWGDDSDYSDIFANGRKLDIVLGDAGASTTLGKRFRIYLDGIGLMSFDSRNECETYLVAEVPRRYTL